MLKNYLLASVRSLRKHLSYSIINITGIGLGLATCLLLSLWIFHELSFDRFHQRASNIYRVSLEYSFGGQTAKTAVSPTALLPALKKNFPEVEEGVRFYNQSSWSPYIIRSGETMFQETKFFYADSTFFKVFSFQLLHGNPDKALTEPNTLVLTQSMAKKYFGTEDVLGKTLNINNRTEYKITGIVEDLPSNSMIQFDFIGSFSSIGAAKEQIWWSANYQTYVLLNEKADLDNLRTKTNEIVKQAVANELGSPGDYVIYNFTPLTDIYLRSEVDEPEVVGSILYVYVFAAIAFLILITACINYVNLATAKASDRAREVGIRKVVGAVRSQLFFQFISESLVVTFFGFCLAFLISQLALPLFNSLTGKSFVGADLLHTNVLVACLVAWVAIAFFAGIYPALAMTSFRPASVLKGNFKRSNKGIWLRQSLVVFQFSVSIILMIGTAVILKQLEYIQEKKLGYDRENVIVIPLDRQAKEKYEQLKTEFERTGFVSSMGRSTELPTKINGGYGIRLPGSKSELGMVVKATAIDKDLVPTLKMKMTTGRNFTEADYKRYSSDSVMSIIVNQSTLKELGLKEEEALSANVSFNGGKTVIVGVVEDFHFSSLQEKISPLVLFATTYEWDLNNALVKLKPGRVNEQLEQLKKISTSLLPNRPFEYEFLDQKYQKMYDKEQRMGQVTTVFSGLAIAIACLGLLGLVAFAAAQKTKEIGIRKVLGATSASIVQLITRDYMKLVLISMLIGIPSAYWLLNDLWLGSFAYHTTIGVAPIIFSALGCLLIAFATASYQAVKAAWTDPTKTLRSE